MVAKKNVVLHVSCRCSCIRKYFSAMLFRWGLFHRIVELLSTYKHIKTCILYWDYFYSLIVIAITTLR